jgi:hypothetical protein
LYNADNVVAVLDGAHARRQHGKDSSTTIEDMADIVMLLTQALLSFV